MIEPALPQKDQPVPLTLAAGQRIVTQALDPVLGWLGAERARVAQALILPPELLEPCPTANINYACNLPAPRSADDGGGMPPEPGFALTSAGAIDSGAEAPFLAASLAGGQVSIVSAGAGLDIIGLRWACITAHASIGAVWRCFLKLRTTAGGCLWTPVAHDYVFEAARGSLLNPPGSLKAALGDRTFTLTYPEGGLTCFPSRSGLVKVTRLCADGWTKRELKGLWLYPSRSIVACFSDGTRKCIATAAPVHAAAHAA